MRRAYLKTLYSLAEKDKNVLSLVSDNGLIVYDNFIKSFPEQYFNFGMSEGHMVSAACGMASCGKIPFLYTISAFLAFRSFEFIRVDACLNKLNVKIVGIGTGLSYGTLGPTHHCTEDISVLRCLPNLTIFSPSTPLKVEKIVEEAYKINGPVYIRLGTNREKEIYDEGFCFEPFKATVLKEGKDFNIISTGSISYEAYTVFKMLEKDGYSVGFIDIHSLKPFDNETIAKIAKNCGKIFTIEEHNIIGGLGSIVSDAIAENGIPAKVHKIGLEDKFGVGYGNHEQVKRENGLDTDSIYKRIINILEKEL